MKKDKKILIIIISSILILLSLLTLFLISVNKNKDKEEIITTTTEKIKESKEMIDEKTKISIKLTDEKYFNNKLLIENIENVVIENIILAYDINLLDENNNKIQVEDTNILISIPYLNVDKYSQFKVLHIDENNNVLETLNASYENEKIYFNVNHLSRYAILGIKDDEVTTTATKVSTTKKNNNSKTTTKADTSNKTTTSSLNNNDSKKEWTVNFYVDGKVSSVVKVKDGNTVAKPKNPSDTNNQVFSHWANSQTMKKFDFNTKIYKNYELYADYKIIEDSTTTTTTTTKKITTTSTTTTKKPITSLTLKKIELVNVESTNTSKINTFTNETINGVKVFTAKATLGFKRTTIKINGSSTQGKHVVFDLYFEEPIDTSKIDYSFPYTYYQTFSFFEILNDRIRLYQLINNYDSDHDLGGRLYQFKYTENGNEYKTKFCIQINQDDFCESWLN